MPPPEPPNTAPPERGRIMRYATGQAIIIFIIAVTVVVIGGTGSAIIRVLDAPSLMPLGIVIAATIFMTGEYKTFTKSVNALLSKKYKISYEDLQRAIGLYRLLAKVVVYTTIISFILGLLVMFGGIREYEFSLWLLGVMFSNALVSVIYGLIANLVFIHPAIHILKHRENSESVKVISEKLVVDKLLELCYKKGISPEEILEANDISLN